MPIPINTANSFLNLAFRGQSYTPPTNLYLGLLDEADSEIATRVDITNKMSAASAGSISNGSEILFPTIESSVVVAACALYAQSSGGEPIDRVTLESPISLQPFSAPRIPAGSVTFSIEQPENEIYYDNEKIQKIDWRETGATHWHKHAFLRGVNCQLSVVNRVQTITNFGSGYYAGVLLPDGRVFCFPNNTSSAAIYDPAKNLTNYIASFGTGYSGGVLLPDGRVFCVPYFGTSAAVYDPVTNAPRELITGFGSGYYGGVLLPDGRVFCVPYTATTAAIYDPVTNAPRELITGFGSGYCCGVLLPDGRVFCVPYNPTTAAIYDPATGNVSRPSLTTGAYVGGVLLPDGRVFCVPYANSTAAIYNPTNGTVIRSGPVSGSYIGGALLPDGRVFCFPYGATSAAIYDPTTGFIEFVSGFPTGSKFSGGVLLPDGRVFCVPRDITSACIYGSARGYTLPPARVLSAYDNKF